MAWGLTDESPHLWRAEVYSSIGNYAWPRGSPVCAETHARSPPPVYVMLCYLTKPVQANASNSLNIGNINNSQEKRSLAPLHKILNTPLIAVVFILTAIDIICRMKQLSLLHRTQRR